MKVPPRSFGSVTVRARRSFISRRVILPVQQFLYTEGLSSLMLLAAALAGIIWANSPAHESYEQIWETPTYIGIGRFAIRESLRHWINDGLMAVFFYIVGMEVKRELVEGDLSSPRRAALPVLAALGGMICPALIYLAFNFSGPALRGWGIPMATDIAFALGVLLLLGKRVPVSLRTFLLALAVADDIGAILVIAVFYANAISLPALGAAGVLLLVVLLMRWGGIRGALAYTPVVVLFWGCVYLSGIHATIAGVIIGMLTPVRPWFSMDSFSESLDELTRRFQRALNDGNHDHAEALLGQLEELSKGTEPPLDRRVRIVHPWSSFVVLPLFALANSGVPVSSAMAWESLTSPTAWGVALGLLVGKPVGIVLFTWLAIRLGWAAMPRGASWGQIASVGLIAGIGFTVSLFVTELAFGHMPQASEAKIGVFVASLLAGVLGLVAFLLSSPRRPADAPTHEAVAS